MNFASVCSGIGAPEVAFRRLGWRSVFMSEIDPFARAVLAHRFPETTLYGDFRQITGCTEPVDLLVGGTPCRTFSVAGPGGGLAHPDGKLALDYLDLVERLRPTWLAWENVTGALSSGRGQAFAAIAQRLADLGYGFGWRVLNARYFGVPQNRRRVFLVGYLGDWRPACAALFERASLSGLPPAGGDPASARAAALGADPWNADGPLAFALRGRAHGANVELSGRVVSAIRSSCGGSSRDYVLDRGRVRRMTAREVERLFGFEDDWTAVPYGKKAASEAQRHKALGLSMAVPVMEYLGERIAMIEAAIRKNDSDIAGSSLKTHDTRCECDNVTRYASQ